MVCGFWGVRGKCTCTVHHSIHSNFLPLCGIIVIPYSTTVHTLLWSSECHTFFLFFKIQTLGYKLNLRPWFEPKTTIQWKQYCVTYERKFFHAWKSNQSDLSPMICIPFSLFQFIIIQFYFYLTLDVHNLTCCRLCLSNCEFLHLCINWSSLVSSVYMFSQYTAAYHILTSSPAEVFIINLYHTLLHISFYNLQSIRHFLTGILVSNQRPWFHMFRMQCESQYCVW